MGVWVINSLTITMQCQKVSIKAMQIMKWLEDLYASTSPESFFYFCIITNSTIPWVLWPFLESLFVQRHWFTWENSISCYCTELVSDISLLPYTTGHLRYIHRIAAHNHECHSTTLGWYVAAHAVRGGYLIPPCLLFSCSNVKWFLEMCSTTFLTAA